MKKLINIILITFLFLSCKDDDKVNPDSKFETHTNKRVSSLLMSKNDYSDWVNNDGFSDSEKRKTLIKDIYTKFSDKYDFIFLILNESTKPSNLKYYGKLIGVSNKVTGIGLNAYDNSATYGSSGKLKSVMQLCALEYLRNGPSLHELMHNWANFGIETHAVDALGNNLTSFDYRSHWGFTGGSTKGQLGGFKQSTLDYLGSNTYSVDPFGFNANGANTIPYTELELYLAGMIPISSVSDFDVFNNITSFNENGSKYEFVASKRTTFTSSSLEQLLGKRVPDHNNSQKSFNLLTVVLTDTPLTEDEWNAVDATAEWFEKKESDGVSPYNFFEATNGIASIKMGE